MSELDGQGLSLAALTAAIPELMTQWGQRTSRVSLIKMRENAVFRVEDETGRPHALRFHRQGYHDDAALRSELQWMVALAEAGVDVPRLLPTLAGEPFAKCQLVPGAEPWRVDLFEWIDGRCLGTSEAGLSNDLADVRQSYFTVGATMARLHLQASGWLPPAGFKRHHWDADGLVGEQPLWGRFWEFNGLSAAQRQLLLHARDVVRQGLRDLPATPDAAIGYSLIHADLVPENILVEPNGRVRLIDFDDAGFGWQLFDLATALYFIQDDPAHDIARDSLLRGYRSHRPLLDSALRYLPLFMTARSFTYLGWVHTRATSPQHLEIAPRLIELACRQAELLLGTGAHNTSAT
ncbi:MAG: phosphotransferase [Burkholderiales bacterium]